MAVAFGSAGTLATNNTGNAAIPYPASIAANDLLVLQYACHHSLTPTTPSGWTKTLGPVAWAAASPAQDGYVYVKVATGSETGTLTISTTGGSLATGGIMSRYTGADTTTPIDVSATSTLPTSGTTATAPSVTTTKANTVLLHMYWCYITSTTITPNASDTERYDSYSAVLSCCWEMADKAQAATGATGTSNATSGTGMSGGLAATIAIAPPGAPATTVARFSRLKVGAGLSGTDLTGGIVRVDATGGGYYTNGATHGAGTTITITAATHGLRASRGLLVQCQTETDGVVVLPDVTVAANGDVTVTFAVSQGANTIRVTVIG